MYGGNLNNWNNGMTMAPLPYGIKEMLKITDDLFK